ncbi:hypothetical protein SAMN06298224_0122 [Fibrobacter sp. UWB16]|jgi:hypothetical protein|uniref:hypothetical protein n=1 Tax=unclassified Fibrobacter TaxID=2634177 RepID=UPI000B520F88|nr:MULTISPECIES: hypothetical protein [unclassified Fibrobacter]OWV21968.1 hypothetical protein B7991_03120 [Fibrobacter sp. UWB3]SOD11343.1 hypothetical protein SAMN06298224_0122 [Fibrobacter sp. UWB16]
MDLLKKLSAIAALAIACPAAELGYFSKHDAGQEVFSFLSTFDSPRNAALEKSAAALPTTDPSIVQLNPAAVLIADGKKRVAEAHWQTGEFADNQGTLSYTTQYKKFILQFSYNWISYGSITGYDEYGEENGSEYKPFSQLVTATVAFPMKHIRFGATLKFVSDKLTGDTGDQTAMAAAFDWGLTWMSDTKNYGFSFVARDFGAMLRSYVKNGSDDYPLSQTFAFGGFFKPRSVPRLTLFGEADFPRYAEPDLNLGAEYALGEYFRIRAGFTRTWLDLSRDFKELASSSSRPDETNEARLFSLGLGYNSSLFAFDYAFSVLPESLGYEHRIGLRVEF